MRVLMTTDAVGGVWQYTLALVRGLVTHHRCRVGLVCFGEPSREELATFVPPGAVDLFVLPWRLEWMPDSEEDVRSAMADILRVVSEWRPDIIHSNQYCFGALRVQIPRVVVGHSDVLSWMMWHRGTDFLRSALKSRDPFLTRYYQLVSGALRSASVVVAPSRFTAESLEELYDCRPRVIHNGLWSDVYRTGPKGNVAVIAGRLWDEAKRAETAVKAVEPLPLELQLIGPTQGPSGEVASLPQGKNVSYRGSRNWEQTRAALAQARYYLATSSYEPFGLAALEAAFCGCAIIANDIPSFRELWEGAAIFYRRNDPDDLRDKLSQLIQSPGSAEEMARAARNRAVHRYGAARMADAYFDLYRSLIPGRA